jgi:hypothetical protein
LSSRPMILIKFELLALASVCDEIADNIGARRPCAAWPLVKAVVKEAAKDRSHGSILVALAGVRFCSHSGLKLGIAPCP